VVSAGAEPVDGERSEPESSAAPSFGEARSEAERPSTAGERSEPKQRGRRASRRELLAILAMAIVVAIADQATKAWAEDALGDGHQIKIVGSLRLLLTYNSGMAFSRGRGFGPVIGVLALVMVVVMLATLRREGSRLARVALGLVIGGAAGNIVDRIFRSGGFLRGEVVDFIDPQFWPVFNVADIAVTSGGALLLLGALFASRRASSAPLLSEPASSAPASSQPASSQPASSEPASSEPAASGPASSPPSS